ncbi:MAG TPA: hypothetical protein VG502_03455 [Flexivirga sp.]|uniref:hypothetical protein n=1 Tax=Flexivirga sp. TaxID=1962927 RepID=UPI002C6ED196|nr:hypothetical protein [Flexivirga sp.]HWC21335.1 hypothetical protein [Flexivirga sp.]
MLVFFATVVFVYATSLCFVIALFIRTVLRERSTPTGTARTVLELAPTQPLEPPAHADVAKTA